MKRLACVLLALCIAFVCALVPAYADVITKAERVLLQEGTQAFIELVSPKMIGNDFVQQGYAQVRVWCPESPVVARSMSGLAAHNNFTICMQETNGVGFNVEYIKIYDYDRSANCIIENNPILYEEGQGYIPPYGKLVHSAGNPRTGNLRYVIFVVSGTDDNGHAQEFYGVAEMLNFTYADNTAAAVDADPERDTRNLRHNAAYEEYVHTDVFWVPAVSLGTSRYTNVEIAQKVNLTPQQKQQEVSTLYEALQLFQIGNFANGDDNVRILEGNINWEHHKPGYDAVRTNEGCCATNSNWLNYILAGDYDEVGFFAYSQSDGGGHIINYIYHNGYYYFIDLTHYRSDFLDSSAPESGDMSDYVLSDFIAGNLHKAASPEAYVDYCRSRFNNPPELFFMYQAENCLPVDGVRSATGICITYANTADIAVVYDDPYDMLTYAFVEPPEQSVDWAAIPDEVFVVEEKYSTDISASAQPARKVEFFNPGDTVSVVEYGKGSTFAELNGEEYILAGVTKQCTVSFEGDFGLSGGCSYSDFSNALPVQVYTQELKNMSNVRLGEIMIDMLVPCENVCIARCVENNGTLTITDVYQTNHYFEQVYVFKDENDQWLPTDKIWYLIHYEFEGQLYKEYGRFQCDIFA